MSMNVLLIGTHLNPGGISRYIINLAKGLSGRGSRVWVASCGGDWQAELAQAGITHVTIPIRTKSIASFKIWRSYRILSRFIKKNPIEIIHANTRVTQFLAYLLYRRFRIPYVSAFHGYYKVSFFRKSFKLAGIRTIAVSRAVKQHLVQDLEMDRDAIRVVYNGINVFSKSAQRSQRGVWGFGSDDFLMGMLGRISAEKGHTLAVEAFSRLSERFNRLYFIIAGRGKEEARLRASIEKHNLSGRIKFVTCGPNEFLDSLDLLLVPSEKEGFGFAIIEAFAKGVPVIAYNTGGIPEIIRHRHNGILFNQYNSLTLADAIEELISQPQLRQRITTQAREDVHEFSLERMARDTEEVYRELLW